MQTPASHDPSAADLFAAIWNGVADLLGTAATAALVRRAVRRAALRCAALEGLAVASQSFTYGYVLPEHWHVPINDRVLAELRLLMRELTPLLSDLTGPVVVRRLERLPACVEYALLDREKTS